MNVKYKIVSQNDHHKPDRESITAMHCINKSQVDIALQDFITNSELITFFSPKDAFLIGLCVAMNQERRRTLGLDDSDDEKNDT